GYESEFAHACDHANVFHYRPDQHSIDCATAAKLGFKSLVAFDRFRNSPWLLVIWTGADCSFLAFITGLLSIVGGFNVRANSPATLAIPANTCVSRSQLIHFPLSCSF